MKDLGHIFDGDRISGYSRLLIGAYIMAFIAMCLMSNNLVDPLGKPIGYDFITFWSAGVLSLEGRAADAFNMQQIFEAQRLAVPNSGSIFLWHYPPTFQLIAAGLALMPYLVSLAVFTGVSLALYVAVLRHFVPWREAPLLLLAFPGMFVCLFHGQNSLLSAALMGGALLTLDRRPIVAGVCIGLLAFKPQLGLLFAPALMLAGRWRTFGAAAATVVMFAGLATLVFGVDLWRVFLANTAVVRQVLEEGMLPWNKIPSVFITLRMMGVGQSIAYGAQTLAAAGVAAVSLYIWWRCGPTRLAGATLVTGTLLLSPYTFDYEMAMLAIPLAILAGELVENGSTRAERIGLVVLFVAPGVFSGLAEAIHVQTGAFILFAVFGWCVQRALAEPRVARLSDLDWLPGRLFAALK